MAEVASGNVTLAFIFVIGAGLATTIGSTFAFCTNLANQAVLAGALGVSAGVMLYVSFAEIFVVKSTEAFAEHGYSDGESTRYATFCFFAGVAFTGLLDKFVNFIASMSGTTGARRKTLNLTAGETESTPVEEGNPTTTVMDEKADKDTLSEAEERDKAEDLQKMGLLTGLAIALHNFPEGLATFVATLADTSVGASIALAIALHNIPEGICVAMPIYYATGSKWKGFWWSFASGISEPIGGLLGYLVLYGDNMSALAYGSLFGLVGGMMVYISVVELIPTALKYDPDDKYVSSCVLVGMGLMAASLLLFTA